MCLSRASSASYRSRSGFRCRAGHSNDSAPEPWTRNSTLDCGVHFGPHFSTKPRIGPAPDCAAHLATENVSENADRGATGRRTQPRTRCDADGLSPGAIRCCTDFSRRHATETQSNSLIQKHIHRRVRRGTVSRIDSGSDSPIAGPRAGWNSWHHAMGGDDSRHEPQDFHDGFAL